MALFRRKEITNSTPTEPTVDDLLFRALLDGSPITKEMALSIPMVSAAVNKITNAFAMTPFLMYQETIKDGKRKTKKIEDSRVSLINDETGDTLDGFQFKKKICEDYLLDCGGFAYIQRAGNKVKSIHYVDSNRITFSINSDPIFKNVAYSCNGKNYNDFDFIRFIRSTENGAKGSSTINELNKALQTAFEAIKYQLKMSQTGGIKRGFLQSEKKLGKEELETLKNAWTNMYSGKDESIVVLNNGLQFKEASATPLEMQLSQIRNNLNNEISSVFGISADDGSFFKWTIQPILVAFETALNRSLLLEKEKHMSNGCLYFAADDRRLTRATMRERYEAYKIAKETGWMTLNEIRYEEDKEEIDGLDIIAMSLGNVLFDVKTGQFYVPNTGEKTD